MTADSPTLRRRGLSRGEATVIVAGTLLVLDLLVAPWHDFGVDVSELRQFGIELPSFHLRRRGVQSPNAFFGIAAAVIAALMVADLLAARLSPAVPRIEQIHLVAGAIVLGLVVAKLLANDDFLAVGAWLAIGLAAALAYGGFLLSQETADAGSRASGP